MPSPPEFQAVFEWKDADSFRKALVKLQERERKSLQLWARRLGYRSPRSLGMVLNGHRRPSAALLATLCTDLGLGGAEAEYVSLLYAASRAKARGRDIPAAINSRMSALRKRTYTQRRILNRNDLSLLSDWLTFVIKQLASTPGFKPKLSWLMSRLRSVEAHVIEQSLASLERVGILRDGKLVDPRALFGPIDIPSAFVRRHHLQMLQQAELAIREEPVDRREIISCTLRLHERDVPQAKERLRSFVDDFEAEFEKEDCCEVAQLNIQFFFHTRSSKP